ncbi:craniofacial development protein 2-like [Halyomorpha halys]|uniref:craniofacial development protein 2-like n=1 Tax=Halyomorpha halys TaxID=286706 RepID=UPI0006D4D18D|nr:craniofacial development protein 2-like [Halyomorpha halys]
MHFKVYSSRENTHEFGVGFVVANKFRQPVIGWKPVNPRICHIRIRGRFGNYSIFCVHAPTEVADDEEKDRFYDSLERTLDAYPSYNVKIIAGDFNAKIGKEEIYRPTIGRHSLHEETNENGQRLGQLRRIQGIGYWRDTLPAQEGT